MGDLVAAAESGVGLFGQDDMGRGGGGSSIQRHAALLARVARQKASCQGDLVDPWFEMGRAVESFLGGAPALYVCPMCGSMRVAYPRATQLCIRHDCPRAMLVDRGTGLLPVWRAREWRDH